MNAKATGTNRKKFLKNFQKPLDKPLKMWYNISTVRETPTE